MSKSSIIITHFDRERNLKNTLQGLCNQQTLPTEVVLVNMGPQKLKLPDYPFPLIEVMFPENWEELPLAKARNYGAYYSNLEYLIFLDVDCIPSARFCELMEQDIQRTEGLVMGLPRYLLTAIEEPKDVTNLKPQSIPHPARPIVDSLRKEECYELFWSLCFGISRGDFEEIGGFDEGYQGYGGEDTDFAKTAKDLQIPFFLNGAEVYHQQHPIYIPPLNHLKAIVKNANLFFVKWGFWPMEDCLSDFAKMGYIGWEPSQNAAIKIFELPTPEAIHKQLVPNAPYR